MSEKARLANSILIEQAERLGTASPTARRLQAASELVFILAAFYAGVTARSAWLVLAIGIISMIAYAAQHWRLWKDAARTGSLSRVLSGVLGSVIVQMLLIALLYLAGLGVWTLLNLDGVTLEIGMRDMIALGVLLGIAIVFGFLAGWLERRA